MKRIKLLAILFLVFMACGKIYDNADVYIKTTSGHEFACKGCSVYLDEAADWAHDDISVINYIDGYYGSEEFTISKSKIAEINIKINHRD